MKIVVLKRQSRIHKESCIKAPSALFLTGAAVTPHKHARFERVVRSSRVSVGWLGQTAGAEAERMCHSARLCTNPRYFRADSMINPLVHPSVGSIYFEVQLVNKMTNTNPIGD
jgi:hypothetical protein